MLKGISEGSKKFNVPIIRGHTNAYGKYYELSSTMIGEIKKEDYISAGNAQIGDDIILAVDFDGKIGKAQDFEASNGNYIHFNGVDVYPFDENSDISVSAWVKVESILSNMIIFWNDDGTAGYYNFKLWDYGRPTLVLFDMSGDALYVDSPTSILTNNWYYIVATFDRTSGYAYIYVDTEKKDTENVGGEGSYSWNKRFEIGKYMEKVR